MTQHNIEIQDLSSQDAARRDFLKKTGAGIGAMGLLPLAGSNAFAAALQTPDMSNGASNFLRSEQVRLQRVSFKNQYGMRVAGNLFTPKSPGPKQKSAAIIVGHPMGAVKEQSANLYATKMAEQGFITLSLDLSFWGESEGKPGHLVAPEIYADDFSAAVDYLSTRSFVDDQRIGVLGICGSGSFAISAAKIGPRMKAIATVSMYDMGSVMRNGLQHSTSVEQRKAVPED